jgi:hypothetical protein
MIDTYGHLRTVDIYAAFLQFVDGFLISTVEGEAGYLYQFVILVIECLIALLP